MHPDAARQSVTLQGEVYRETEITTTTAIGSTHARPSYGIITLYYVSCHVKLTAACMK